jgi:hypothetical protein
MVVGRLLVVLVVVGIIILLLVLGQGLELRCVGVVGVRRLLLRLL